MMMKIQAILILFIFFTSCSGRNEEKIDKKDVNKSANNTTKVTQKKQKIITTIFDDVQTTSLPYVDSTNYDNYTVTETIDPKLVNLVKLSSNKTAINKVNIKYRLPISDKFDALVVSYFNGESELFTTLITIDHDNIIIDQVDIAYDEVAESAFRSWSIISKNNITKEDWKYMDGNNPIYETMTIQITDSGKFKVKQT